MDMKPKSVMKLIDEVDSITTKAEIYCEKNPELRKSLDEFYEAYRILSERLNDSNENDPHELHTIEESFPCQSPSSIFSYDFPSPTSISEDELHSLDTPQPLHPCFECDTMKSDGMTQSILVQGIRRTGMYPEDWNSMTRNKGLKQLLELFRTREGECRMKLLDGRLCKSWNNRERQIRPWYQIYSASFGNGRRWSEGREDSVYLSNVQDHVSLPDKISEVNSESGSVANSDKEFHNLQELVSKLGFEKEVVLHQYQECFQRISSLENEICHAKEGIILLNGEIQMNVTKLAVSEKQHLHLESKYKKLQSKMDNLKQDSKNSNLKYDEKTKNLELEFQQSVQTMKNLENLMRNLEDKILNIKEENCSLHEKNMSSVFLIKELRHEIMNLKEVKVKLEREIFFLVEEKKSLESELNCLKEELKETCIKSTDEKKLLTEKLSYAEKILENYELMEISLAELNVEIQGYKGNLRNLDEQNQSLLCEKSIAVAENGRLVSYLESISDALECLSQDKISMDICVLVLSIEHGLLREKSMTLLNSYQYLCNKKCKLLNENHLLASQASYMICYLLNLQKAFSELKTMYSSMEEEKKLSCQENNALNLLLRKEEEKHAKFFASTIAHAYYLENQIVQLKEEARSNQRCLEEEEDKATVTQIEILVLQSSIQDLKERQIFMSNEFESLMEEVKCLKEIISELEGKNSFHEVKIQSLLQEKENTDMEMNQILKLLELEHSNEGEYHIQHLIRKIKEMKDSLIVAKDEKQMQVFSNLVYYLFFHQLWRELLEMKSTKMTLEGVKRDIHECQKKYEDSEMEKEEMKKRISVLLEHKIHQEIEIQCVYQEKNKMAEELDSLRRGMVSQRAHTEEMKTIISNLSSENGELKSEIESYLPLLSSLKDRIKSLHEKTHLPSGYQATRDKEKQDFSEACGPVMELWSLNHEVEEIEKRVSEMRRYVVKETQNVNTSSESTVTEIETTVCEDQQAQLVSSSRNSVHHYNKEEDWTSSKSFKIQSISNACKPVSGFELKDKRLDFSSNFSFKESKSGNSFEKSSKKRCTESGNSILQNSIYREQGKKGDQDEEKKEITIDSSSVEIPSKSMKFSIQQDHNILSEKLNSDYGKLMDLKTIMEGLKKKLVISSTLNDPTGLEYESVRGHLKEVEKSFSELSDRIRRRIKQAKSLPSKTNTKCRVSDESTIILRQQVSAFAEKDCEKIGRLEIELQRIEFIMMKVEAEFEARKSGNRSPVLSDYIYGLKEKNRRTKSSKCMCILPVIGFL